MKILYFHQYFNTPRAAGGTRSYEMARQLIARGHQVTMICAKSGDGDLGLPGKPDDSVHKGIVSGYQAGHEKWGQACLFDVVGGGVKYGHQ